MISSELDEVLAVLEPLDTERRLLAAVARRLAAELDGGPPPYAIAGLVRELRAVIVELLGASPGAGVRLRDLDAALGLSVTR